MAITIKTTSTDQVKIGTTRVLLQISITMLCNKNDSTIGSTSITNVNK